MIYIYKLNSKMSSGKIRRENQQEAGSHHVQIFQTHIQRVQVIINLDHVLHGGPDGADDTVDHVDDAVGGHLVAVDDPGTVDGHHLEGAPQRLSCGTPPGQARPRRRRLVPNDGGAHPVGVVIDEQTQVVVHGRDGHAVAQVFGQEAFVDHVEMQGVVELNVDVADKRGPHGLSQGGRRKRTILDG